MTRTYLTIALVIAVSATVVVGWLVSLLVGAITFAAAVLVMVVLDLHASERRGRTSAAPELDKLTIDVTRR